MPRKQKNLPLVSDVLELYAQTPEGIPLWKTKGMELNCENLLENIFVLSSDIAAYFGIRHDHLCAQNISKLQKTKYLPDQLPKLRELITVGKSAKKPRMVYAITRQQTEHLIMDFSGPRAFSKKHDILNRLQAIEADVLHGAYFDAREKARSFDGVQLLKDWGFSCSVENRLATKKDIAKFLNVPESTISTFLRKQKDQIQPVKLDVETIRNMGSRANKMNAYYLEDVLKIAFWMQSEVSGRLKQQLLGNSSSMLLKGGTRQEMEWRAILTRIFDGFDLRYNYTIGKYRVDFFVVRLSLALEYDENHSSYDIAEEEEREKYIARHHTLIRFNDQTSLETLVNAILKVQIQEVVKLYG